MCPRKVQPLSGLRWQAVNDRDAGPQGRKWMGPWAKKSRTLVKPAARTINRHRSMRREYEGERENAR